MFHPNNKQVISCKRKESTKSISSPFFLGELQGCTTEECELSWATKAYFEAIFHNPQQWDTTPIQEDIGDLNIKGLGYRCAGKTSKKLTLLIKKIEF